MNSCNSCDSALVAGPNSIPNNDARDAISVYPNPSANEIFVTNANSTTWSILNALGEPVMSGFSGPVTTRIDISDLPAGSDTLQICQNEAISGAHFVKIID